MSEGKANKPAVTVLPFDIRKKIRLMGHHHLCLGAFETLFRYPAFRQAYPELARKLKLKPELLVETIYGYDVLCYICPYWSEDGRCVTGWRNKISKDEAVLKFLGIRIGEVHKLKNLQKLLAKKITPEVLAKFCGAGEWKCEFYLTGLCQQGYEKLRKKFFGKRQAKGAKN